MGVLFCYFSAYNLELLTMKKKLLLSLAILASSFSFAQNLKVGVKAGMNVSSVQLKDFNTSADYNSIFAYHFGAEFSFKLTNHLSLGADALISAEGYNESYGFEDQDQIQYEFDNRIEIGYIKTPLYIKYYPVANVGLNIQGGIQPGFQVYTRSKVTGSYEDSELSFFDSHNLNVFQVDIPVGVAYDFKKHFSIGARYSHALRPVTDYQQGKLYNRTFMINASYRF